MNTVGWHFRKSMEIEHFAKLLAFDSNSPNIAHRNLPPLAPVEDLMEESAAEIKAAIRKL